MKCREMFEEDSFTLVLNMYLISYVFTTHFCINFEIG